MRMRSLYLVGPLVLLGFLIWADRTPGQQSAGAQPQLSVGTKESQDQKPLKELQEVLAQARKIDDALTRVKLSARAANSLWIRDPIQAQSIFRELWEFIGSQSDKAFDAQAARTTVLKYLFPRNPSMANKLLKESLDQKNPSLQARASGIDSNMRRLADLSLELASQDPLNAASLLEQSFAAGISPVGLGALNELRQQYPELADYVVSRTLDRAKTQPTIIALTGMNLLIAYIFPANQAPFELWMGDSSAEILRFHYFAAASDVLRLSLLELDENLRKMNSYSDSDLRFRAIYQAKLAMNLAVLSRRYDPAVAGELSALAAKLSVNIPPNMLQLSQFTAARLGESEFKSSKPEDQVALALTRGDFAEASKLIDKIDDEVTKKSLGQTLAKVEVKTRIAKSEFNEALTAARKIEEPSIRSLFYSQIAKGVYAKKDVVFSRLVVNEAKTFLISGKANGLTVRAALSLFAEALRLFGSDEISILQNAISQINTLEKTADSGSGATTLSEAAMAEISDPKSLLDAPEFSRAFNALGALDLECALSEAGTISPQNIRIAARLASLEPAMKQKPKTPVKTVSGDGTKMIK